MCLVGGVIYVSSTAEVGVASTGRCSGSQRKTASSAEMCYSFVGSWFSFGCNVRESCSALAVVVSKGRDRRVLCPSLAGDDLI